MLAGVRDSSGWHVQGTEFSEDTAHIGTEINGVEILAAPSLQSAGFKAESFDYIFANNVLEHLPEPYSFLKDVRGLLKPGGYLHLILPNGVNDISPNEIVWKRKRTALGARHDGHIWFFSEHSLRILFEKSGFITEKFLGFHFTDALKSRGLWPGAIGRFEKKHFKPAEDANRSRPAAAKPSIPPKRSRIIDDASALLRGIFKLSYFRGGGDFDILLRRKQ
jgi:SAM-dependent methyltransferase